MNNSNKLDKEIYGYIADINPQEIASHIADGTLNNWLQVWRSSFKYCIHQCIEEYRKEDGWILVSEKTPKLKKPVLLAYIDRELCDVHVATGYKFLISEEIYVYYSSDNYIPINGKVVAWKPC